jgi:sec-independent protein translocase protein TatA
MFEGLFQPMHLLVIGVIALIVFGPRRLPELGRGLGDGIREFKKSMSDLSVEKKPSVNQKTESQGSLEITQTGAPSALNGNDH